jgi:hypothetical protein
MTVNLHHHGPDLIATSDRLLIRARISANNDPAAAASAIWNTTYRECLITLAPVFTSFTWSVLSDQSLILFGKALVLQIFLKVLCPPGPLVAAYFFGQKRLASMAITDYNAAKVKGERY